MTDFNKLAVSLPSINIEQLNINEILAINVDNLEETLQYQPTLHCTFGCLCREAERQLAEVEAEIDLLESAIRREMYTRSNLENKRIVKDYLLAECSASPNYNALQRKKRILDHAVGVLTTIEESFSQRFGMIQQIAKRRSNELSQLPQAP